MKKISLSQIAEIEKFLTYESIVNNLIDGGTIKVLSAEQGKILKAELNAIKLILSSDDINLDTIQEIVDAIKNVEMSLDTILVNDLTTGGLTKALTAEQGKVLKEILDLKLNVSDFKVKDVMYSVSLSAIGALDFNDDIPGKLAIYNAANLPADNLDTVYRYEVTENIPVNFWIESSDWSTASKPINSEATFVSFLQRQGATNIVITDFSLVNNGALKCNLNCDSMSSLYMTEFKITDVVSLGEICSSLTDLYLNGNQIVDFNPTIPLPNTLNELYLKDNQIVDFNPTIPLPNTLTDLILNGNQIVDFNPTLALPNTLNGLYLNGNQIVDFNPTLALPTSLVNLYLNGNQITTDSWNNETEWISSLSPSGILYIIGTNASIVGTNSETLLLAKEWTIFK